MTALSALMGFALPNLMPREYTHFAGALLFFYFGVRLLRDGYLMESSGPSEELAEVEEELSFNKKGDAESINTAPKDLETGDGDDADTTKKSYYSKESLKVFSQVFTLTFLAEW
eukprot:CAMPEP_0113938574 /NCGR_PEP_ID=MMETSP1339-20121228/4998_1 /TAXON_ID=94617 /ORGANISM="Fibrocapsa japonica" /LENGTH=113 /DNA_ID=CAMNT_0000941757 /DNA_START=45 /DNA_END=383 /DNA_ORIENTATION=+ /assembly_acc=CAM_ASM_000762